METDPVLKSKRLFAIVPIIAIILNQIFGLPVEEESIKIIFDLFMSALATSLILWSKISEIIKQKD